MTKASLKDIEHGQMRFKNNKMKKDPKLFYIFYQIDNSLIKFQNQKI